MKKILKNNRGFSLAEAIIALAIVLIVSATSLTVVISSVSARKNINNRFTAQVFADNVLESFKACDGSWDADFDKYSHLPDENYEDFETNFERALNFALGVSFDIVELEPTKIKYVYDSAEQGFKAEIEVSKCTETVGEDTVETGRHKIIINMKTDYSMDDNRRKPIISIEYVK